MNDYIDTGLQDCTAVIAAFGGIRPMAHKLGVPVSTVQGWKQRNAIPQNRVGDILAAADTHNIDLAAVIDASGPDEASPTPAADSPVISPARTQIGGSVRKQNDRGAFSVALVALIVAIAAGGWSVFGDRQSAGFTGISERLTALETAPKTGDTAGSRQQFADDLTELRAALDRIAKVQEEFTGPGEDIGQIIERLEAAETRLDQTQRNSARQARAAKAATSASLAAAQGEIEKLRLQLTALGGNRPVAGQNAASAVGLSLAAGRLRRAIDNGDAYESVLATLRTLSEDDAAIGAILDRLSKHAGTGVAARDALARAFPSVARDVATAANSADASGWTGRTLQRIRNTVSIRRIGADVPGDTPGAKVARAEAKLLDGDLAGAVAEVHGLTGAAAAAAATWLGDARARYDAEVAVGELEALAIARLQAGSSGS